MANKFTQIRSCLGVTQAEIAQALGMTQGNVSFLERGQCLRPENAAALIEFAKGKGMTLSYDQIYGDKPLPTRRYVVRAGR